MTREEILTLKIEDLKKNYNFLLECQRKDKIELAKAKDEGEEALVNYYQILIDGNKEELEDTALEISKLEKEISSSSTNWLNIICKKFNMTRYSISKRTGVYESMLSRIINNNIHYLKVEFKLILGISIMLDMTLDEFYGELKKTDIDEFYQEEIKMDQYICTCAIKIGDGDLDENGYVQLKKVADGVWVVQVDHAQLKKTISKKRL